MNEQDVNLFLQINNSLASNFRKAGEENMATKIESIGSKVASKHLKIIGVKNHKVICSCGRWLRKANEIEFYKNVGYCPWCDHLFSDIHYD